MYIQLNSQIICYEKTGEGSPVILIHGNKEDHHIFDALAQTMSKNHTVVAMDSRGHGESATPKEYHYADMATDVINLIQALELKKPYLIGFSDGAIIAMLVAMRKSAMLSGIICCGGNASPAGLKHHILHEIKKEFKKTNDPLLNLMLTEPNIDDFSLASIRTRTLIIAGEKDCIKEKETKHIGKTIPNAQTLILSKEDHTSYIYNTDKLYSIIKDFLI